MNGSLSGSKQKTKEVEDLVEGAKKQKVVSSDDLSVVDSEGSTGRFQPACRKQ